MAEKLTPDQLERIIRNNDNSQLLKNESYYQGKNKTLVEKTNNGRPDWRAPLPIGRKTVADIQGYAFKPGNVKYVFDTQENNEADIEKIEEIFKANDENLISSEVFADALVKGEGAEIIWWEGGSTLPKFRQIPREQCIFIYEDTLEEKLSYSIRYYISKTVNEKGETIEIHHADVYHEDRIDFYQDKVIATDQTLDNQTDTQRTDTEENRSYKWIKEEKHFFLEPPLYPYIINKDRFGIYQPCIPIIDILDNVSSDSIANSIDRFNETLLALSKKLTPEVLANIKDFSVFDGLGGKEEGNFIEYIQRKIDISGTTQGFELFERLYYDLVGVPNMHAEKFNDKSGIALLYALIPFENMVSTIETYFTKGLKHRLDLLNNLEKMDLKANIDWKRNLPKNIQELILQAIQLKQSGLVSTETAMRVLPEGIIDDVDIEIKKVKEEKEENMSLFGDRFNEDDTTNQDDDKEEDKKDDEKEKE